MRLRQHNGSSVHAGLLFQNLSWFLTFAGERVGQRFNFDGHVFIADRDAFGNEDGNGREIQDGAENEGSVLGLPDWSASVMMSLTVSEINYSLGGTPWQYV